MSCIGIRVEDKYDLERRVPIIPSHIKRIKDEMGVDIHIERSDHRVFSDKQFEDSGATLTDKISDCDLILGVKEIPVDKIESGKSYAFFPHVTRGQARNMPMLKKLVEKGCSLIDYESITDPNGNRLLHFSYFAGVAGMIDNLWALGHRLEHQGIENFFSSIKQAWKYNSMDDVKRDISLLGHKIAKHGVPEQIGPVVIGFTGYGKVYSGASEILDLLPVKEIRVPELLELKDSDMLSNNIIYKVVFKEEDLSIRKDRAPFSYDEYRNYPDLYESKFEKYIEHLTVLVNCMHWSPRYPKLITKDYLKNNYSTDHKLKVISDITCDIEGSIESTIIATMPDDPVYVYDPRDRTVNMGFEGFGPLMVPIGILPSELPRESSILFSNALFHYLPFMLGISSCEDYHQLHLPQEIEKALILFKGELTPQYSHLKHFLD